jgi:hypothetical protein
MPEILELKITRIPDRKRTEFLCEGDYCSYLWAHWKVLTRGAEESEEHYYCDMCVREMYPEQVAA